MWQERVINIVLTQFRALPIVKKARECVDPHKTFIKHASIIINSLWIGFGYKLDPVACGINYWRVLFDAFIDIVGWDNMNCN